MYHRFWIFLSKNAFFCRSSNVFFSIHCNEEKQATRSESMERKRSSIMFLFLAIQRSSIAFSFHCNLQSFFLFIAMKRKNKSTFQKIYDPPNPLKGDADCSTPSQRLCEGEFGLRKKRSATISRVLSHLPGMSPRALRSPISSSQWRRPPPPVCARPTRGRELGNRHRLNGQGGSQGLPPPRPLVAAGGLVRGRWPAPCGVLAS